MSMSFFPKGPRKTFDRLLAKLPSHIEMYSKIDDGDLSKLLPGEKHDPTRSYALKEIDNEDGWLWIYFNQEGKFMSATKYGCNCPAHCLDYLGFHQDAELYGNDLSNPLIFLLPRQKKALLDRGVKLPKSTFVSKLRKPKKDTQDTQVVCAECQDTIPIKESYIIAKDDVAVANMCEGCHNAIFIEGQKTP